MNIVMHVDSVPVNVLPANNKCRMLDNHEIELLEQENDHLLEILLSQDIVHICVNFLATRNDYREMQQSYIYEYNKNLVLKAELAKKEHTVEKKNFDEVVLRCSRLENHEPLSRNLLKNMDAHIDYIKHTQDNADILRGLFEHVRVLRPLDSDLDSNCQKVTIEGNRCPLTRTTSTNIVPYKNPLPPKVAKKTPTHRNNPEMLKDVTNKSSSSRSNGVEYNVSINSKPSQNWRSNVSTALSSSLVNLSFRLVPNPPSPTPYVPPTKKDWDTLFQLMFDEYFIPPSSVASSVHVVVALEPVDSTGTPSSTTIDQDAPSPSTSQTPQETQSPIIPFDVEEHFHDIKVAYLDNDPFFGVLIPKPHSKESSLRDVIPTNVHSVNQPSEHLRK
nr:hypothetical protein [Tanacetum cinerariifolium]